MSKSKKEIKKELYEYFSYMQQEDNKSLLGGMAGTILLGISNMQKIMEY